MKTTRQKRPDRVIGKSKITRITYKLRDEIFNVNLMYSCGCTATEYLQFLNSEGIYPKENITNYDGYFNEARRLLKNGSYIYDYYIWVCSSKNIVSISHELIHLTTRIMKDIGLPINYKNDEFIAYYHSYWLRKILSL